VADYSVIHGGAEIGIRMTTWRPAGQVVRGVTGGMFGMVCLGLAIGWQEDPRASASSRPSVRSEGDRSRNGGRSAGDAAGRRVLAALPPAIRAVKIDPLRLTERVSGGGRRTLRRGEPDENAGERRVAVRSARLRTRERRPFAR